MSPPDEVSDKPKGVSGSVVVVVFLAICFLVAAGSLAVTISGQMLAPQAQPPPPEIGHPLVPTRP